MFHDNTRKDHGKMNTDDSIHEFHKAGRCWRKLPGKVPAKYEKIRYYYAESRLYEFLLPSGAVILSEGSSPLIALDAVANEIGLKNEVSKIVEQANLMCEDAKSKALAILRSMEGDIVRGNDASGFLGSLIDAVSRYEGRKHESSVCADVVNKEGVSK